jgi:hypothetical protein
MKQGYSSKLHFLERHAHMMSWELAFGSGPAFGGYQAWRSGCVPEEEGHLKGGRPHDNRTVWSQVLSSEFREPNDDVDVPLSMLRQ